MALDSLNDACWRILDWLEDHGIPIGPAFDKYNIPAVLFPMMIILFVLLAFWVLTPSGRCGDGSCSGGEDCTGCPLDCGACPTTTAQPSTGVILSIELVGQINDSVTVSIFDQNDKIINSETAKKSVFEFPNTKPQMVKAVVTCKNGVVTQSKMQKVDESNNKISVNVPKECSKTLKDENGNTVKTHGNLVVQVYDAETNLPLDAIVSVLRSSDNLAEDSKPTLDGEVEIALRSGNNYYIIVTSPGYVPYRGDPFYMVPGDTLFKKVRLSPNAMRSVEGGSLRVCAYSESGPLGEGRISVYEVGGSEIRSKLLASSDRGCATFDVPSGVPLKASMASLSSGCVSLGFSEEITLDPGDIQAINMPVSCQAKIAYVKAIVHDRRGNVLTDKVVLTLWNAVSKKQLPGTALDGSLAVGADGYTEEVPIPAETLVQVKAARVPLAFIDTSSGPAAFRANEHGTIDVVLGESSYGRFSFQGASIIYTPATPGSPFHVFVERIVYDDTELTNKNSNVSVLINGVTYNATYSGRVL